MGVRTGIVGLFAVLIVFVTSLLIFSRNDEDSNSQMQRLVDQSSRRKRSRLDLAEELSRTPASVNGRKLKHATLGDLEELALIAMPRRVAEEMGAKEHIVDSQQDWVLVDRSKVAIDQINPSKSALVLKSVSQAESVLIRPLLRVTLSQLSYLGDLKSAVAPLVVRVFDKSLKTVVVEIPIGDENIDLEELKRRVQDLNFVRYAGFDEIQPKVGIR
jgi:hypothetical protein